MPGELNNHSCSLNAGIGEVTAKRAVCVSNLVFSIINRVTDIYPIYFDAVLHQVLLPIVDPFGI
jgi:hypothetical protein